MILGVSAAAQRVAPEHNLRGYNVHGGRFECKYSIEFIFREMDEKNGCSKSTARAPTGFRRACSERRHLRQRSAGGEWSGEPVPGIGKESGLDHVPLWVWLQLDEKRPR